MNAKNAVGMVGGIISKMIGYAMPKLDKVPDEAVEWAKSEAGELALRKATEGLVDTLLLAYEEFKREAARLFAPAGEFNFPGATEKWRAGEFFTTANQKTKFWHVDSSLLTFLGDEEIGGSPARKLVVQHLRRNAKDEEILPQLGENRDLTPTEFRWLLEKGNLSSGRWHAGYITNSLGVRRAVGFDLGGYGLYVRCCPVPRAGVWSEGYRFVSPAKSCENLGS